MGSATNGFTFFTRYPCFLLTDPKDLTTVSKLGNVIITVWILKYNRIECMYPIWQRSHHLSDAGIETTMMCDWQNHQNGWRLYCPSPCLQECKSDLLLPHTNSLVLISWVPFTYNMISSLQPIIIRIKNFNKSRASKPNFPILNL